MSPRDFGLLLLLSVLFGSAFLFIRIAAPVFGPLFLMDARVLLAAGTLALWALVTKQRLSFGGRWRDWFTIGALNAALPYTLIAFAELHVTSALAALFMALLPLFTTVVAVLWGRERLTPKMSVGLALGFVGVVVMSGWSTPQLTPTTLLSLGALLLAALSYALGLVYTEARFDDTPPLTLSVGNFLAAGVLLLPFALTAPPPQVPSPLALLTLAALVLLPTALALVLDFHLLKKLGASRLSLVAYLIPISGALLGVVFLNEALSSTALVSFSLILVGVVLATDAEVKLPPLRRRRLKRQS